MKTLLHGHISPETAFIVADYPYGFRLRCKMRCWIETATKGGGKGQQRHMTQTTNPKVSVEVWNKPKGSTYSAMRIMYQAENGHVEGDGLNMYASPEDIEKFLVEYGPQFSEEQRTRFEFIRKLSRKMNPNCWAKWDLQTPV